MLLVLMHHIIGMHSAGSQVLCKLDFQRALLLPAHLTKD